MNCFLCSTSFQGNGECIDRIKPASSICRAAVSECDIVERCDGSSKTCPADEFAPASTTCDGSGAPAGTTNTKKKKKKKRKVKRAPPTKKAGQGDSISKPSPTQPKKSEQAAKGPGATGSHTKPIVRPKKTVGNGGNGIMKRTSPQINSGTGHGGNIVKRPTKTNKNAKVGTKGSVVMEPNAMKKRKRRRKKGKKKKSMLPEAQTRQANPLPAIEEVEQQQEEVLEPVKTNDVVITVAFGGKTATKKDKNGPS